MLLENLERVMVRSCWVVLDGGLRSRVVPCAGIQAISSDDLFGSDGSNVAVDEEGEGFCR